MRQQITVLAATYVISTVLLSSETELESRSCDCFLGSDWFRGRERVREARAPVLALVLGETALADSF